MRKKSKADLPCGGDCFNCPYDDCIVDGLIVGESAPLRRDASLCRYHQKVGCVTSEKRREYGRNYYAEHRRERLDYQKARYLEKREQLQDYQLSRYAVKREQLKEYQRAYYQAHKDEINQKRRKKRQADN